MRTSLLRTILEYVLCAALAALLAMEYARCTLPGALAQSRPIRGTKGVTAAHALLPDAPIARDGLATITGAHFADDIAAAPLYRTTDSILGCSVWIGDEPQPLRLVTPDRIVFAPRHQTTWFVVRAQDGQIYYAPSRMAETAPALFYAGSGMDARDQLTERPNPQPDRLPLALWRQGSGIPQLLTEAGIPASTERESVRLSLEGTGWRNAPLDSLRATLGETKCPIVYAGASVYAWAGQDVLVIEIPATLRERGPLPLVIEAAGQQSNAGRVVVR